MSKYLLILLLFITKEVTAQQLQKQDKDLLADLKSSVEYLADDRLEGRRAGSRGEKLAYEFISKCFLKNNLIPRGDSGSFLQRFEINEGNGLTAKNFLKIGGNEMVLYEDYVPMPFSARGSANLATGSYRTGRLFIRDLLDSNKDNPHFDLKESVTERIKRAEDEGARIYFIFDTAIGNATFDERDKASYFKIPVFRFNASGTNKYLSVNNDLPSVSYNIETAPKVKYGHNVIGYIDNNAAATIIIGAHYDHLGYGEDHNSLYTGKAMIHNGADDNASGTAALIELSDILKKSSLKKYNYLFVAFSGEELGLFGSKYFTEHSPVNLNSVNYMINMDMVGRLNDSTRGLNIGGYGTSPQWSSLVDTAKGYFKIKTDSSGTGPSDHTSFYRKDIPVLFFFTGTHRDYHKPSDDADKINYNGEMAVIKFIYNIITLTDTRDKLSFSKTREAASMGKSSFKVTMGIMPDYSFSGNGLRVDGVSEGRLHKKQVLLREMSS